MADIITADNLPLVIGAIGTVIGAVFAARQGGRLGERARSNSPPRPDTIVAGGLIMSNVATDDMIRALHDIAHAVREATDEARASRSSRTETLLSRIEASLSEMAAGERGNNGRH